MGSFYDYTLGNRKHLDLGRAVLDYSLFSEYMLSTDKVNVTKKGTTYDFIMTKYGYGTNGLTRDDIRHKYYTEGFSIDWSKYYSELKGNKNEPQYQPITYKMLMRSNGKAKSGESLFINEKLYDLAYEYISMGIRLPDDNAKLVEMAAYNSLCCASMIDSITIPLSNILILEDREVSTYKKAVIVKTKKDLREIQIPDYRASEPAANKRGYTFYKRNQAVERDFTYIKNRTIKNLESLDIPIVKKSNGKSLDFLSIEADANKLGYTFYRKKGSKEGHTLIDRDVLIAEKNRIHLEYKTVQRECDMCYVDRQDSDVKITNTLFDGMGLIDSCLMPNGCSGFVYLRNHMTKFCAFEGEVIQFLKDQYGDKYYTATRRDCFGNEIKVKDIRVITTDRAIKWTKFDGVTYSDYDKALAKYGYKFSVVKTAHRSKYGNLQRMSYQSINSLPCLDEGDLHKIAQTSIDYFNRLKTDNNAFLDYLTITANKYSINSFLVDLVQHCPEIVHSIYYSNQKKSILSKFKREGLELGKIMQEGDNLTIAGNVYALLLYAANSDDWMNDLTLSVIDGGVQCYTTRFADGAQLCGYRSPHNSPNNYGYYVNHYSKEMQTYFPNLGDNVICVNMFGTDNQARLNGHDMDSDSIYCTTSPEIVKYAKVCYRDYPTILNEIPLFENKSYSNTLNDYAKMDSSIARYQYGIGSSSNLAQLALSYYWHEVATAEVRNEELEKELEDVYIISSVLAQCFIDSAKRQFALDLNSELSRLSRLPCMDRDGKYPRFFAKIKESKVAVKQGDSENKKKAKTNQITKINSAIIENCKCPMDIIAKIIHDNVEDMRGQNKNVLIDIGEFLPRKCDIKLKDRKRKNMVADIINVYDQEMCNLDRSADNYKVEASALTDDVIDRLSSISIGRSEMYYLVRIAFGLEKKKYNKYFCNRILIVLHNYDISRGTKTLLNLFKNKSNAYSFPAKAV